MLPFSKYMARIWSKTKTPVIAVWVNVIFCALLGLIDLASFTAITAIFNVTAICVDWSCCIPILCKVFDPRSNSIGKLELIER
jgi:amino acid transporter